MSEIVVELSLKDKLFSKASAKEELALTQIMSQLDINKSVFLGDGGSDAILDSPEWKQVHELILRLQSPEAAKYLRITPHRLLEKLSEDLDPEILKEVMWEEALRDLETAWKLFKSEGDRKLKDIPESFSFLTFFYSLLLDDEEENKRFLDDCRDRIGSDNFDKVIDSLVKWEGEDSWIQ